MTETSLEQLKQTYEKLAFIHQVLTQRTQYFLEETEIANDSARMVTEMANKLSDEIASKAQPETPVETEPSAPVEAE